MCLIFPFILQDRIEKDNSITFLFTKKLRIVIPYVAVVKKC